MAEEECGAEEETVMAFVPAPGSPKSKVKFLCSHGGKILPRPADGHLKYVGGEIRVVSIPRNIDFAELMKKLATLDDGDVILKYQLIPEDLDVLVSVKSDEDLRHMLDEYNRYENAGAPRLRAFLFPANPVMMETHMSPMDPRALEQRYIDAVNGIVRPSTAASLKNSSTCGHPSSLAVSSAGSSPKSPESYAATDFVGQEAAPLNSYLGNRVYMPRVQSSPSMSNLIGQHWNNHSVHQHHQHYHQNYQHHSGYQSPWPLHPDRLSQLGQLAEPSPGSFKLVRSRLGIIRAPDTAWGTDATAASACNMMSMA